MQVIYPTLSCREVQDPRSATISSYQKSGSTRNATFLERGTFGYRYCEDVCVSRDCSGSDVVTSGWVVVQTLEEDLAKNFVSRARTRHSLNNQDPYYEAWDMWT